MFSGVRPIPADYIRDLRLAKWDSEVGSHCGSRTAHVRFGSKADIGLAQVDVRFVPFAEIALLFDYFVSTAKQWQRNVEAERFGSLKIDHKVEFGCPHHR
jgi:hypothetical protein